MLIKNQSDISLNSGRNKQVPLSARNDLYFKCRSSPLLNYSQLYRPYGMAMITLLKYDKENKNELSKLSNYPTCRNI